VEANRHHHKVMHKEGYLMADADIDSLLGVTDKRKVGGAGITNTQPITLTNYKDVAALKARLTAINATSYTPARLATMTENDMVYAVRLNDDAAGI
jgi:hypothetical protein